MTIRTAILAAASLSRVAAGAEEAVLRPTYAEVSYRPLDLEGRLLELEGIVDGLKLNPIKGRAYYSFYLRKYDSRNAPFIFVVYRVECEGQRVDEFRFREGDFIRVRGRYFNMGHDRLSTKLDGMRHLGQLEANKDACDELKRAVRAPKAPSRAGDGGLPLRTYAVEEPENPTLLDEAAFNPMKFNGQSVRVKGTVERIKYYPAVSIDGGSYHALLYAPGRKRHFNLIYHVRVRGVQFDEFPFKEGEQVEVRGMFKTQRSKTGDSPYVGNLYVNKERYDELLREVGAATRTGTKKGASLDEVREACKAMRKADCLAGIKTICSTSGRDEECRMIKLWHLDFIKRHGLIEGR